MKIAVSSYSGDPDQEFSSRFGRCDFFLVYDTAAASWEKLSNPAAEDQSGAGSRVVQFLVDNGVEAIISGRYGPNAFFTLEASGIKPYIADSGTPAGLIEKYDRGELLLAASPSGEGWHGGGGGGRGRGRGMGRGGGRD